MAVWRKLWRPWKPDDVTPDEARAAVEQAEADLQDTQALDRDIDRLAWSMRHTVKRNHFSEAMEALAAEMSKKRHT